MDNMFGLTFLGSESRAQAPTFIELAGGTPPATMDGKSMAGLLRSGGAPKAPAAKAARRAPRDDFLIEYTGLSDWPKGPKPWDCARNDPRGRAGCSRVNDSPNNTFRGLRIFADDYSLGSASHGR
jgi:hypothetical protein